MTDEEPQGPSRWIRARNVALQYVGVGWFLTQVVAVMAKQFDWPAAVSDYLVIGLGAGLVLTILTALIMERGPSRSRRTQGLALAVLAAFAGLVVWIMGGGLPDFRAERYGLVHESRALFSSATDVSAFLVVHPQQPFLPTDIRVEAGGRLEAWADGRINIGVARLVEAVQTGDVEAYDWVGPAGEIDATGQPILRADRGVPGREECLLNRAFPYGALLLAVSPNSRLTPAEARELVPGREIFAVGTHLDVEAGSDGYLFLGVNDVYLDRPECRPDETPGAGRDADIFFLDNIGFFSVRLGVR